MLVNWAPVITPSFTFWQPGVEFNPIHHKVMVYIIVGIDHRRHYIGCTKDIHHRLRQHNSSISGGAKRTKKYSKEGKLWTPIYLVTGFTDRRSALRFETKLQHCKVRKGNLSNHQWGFKAISAVIASGDGGLSWPTMTIYCY